MTGLGRKLYSPPLFDVLFAVVAIGCLWALALGAGAAAAAVPAAEEPLRKGLTVVGLLLAAAAMAGFVANRDQRLADDFLFQALTKSAMIGMFTLVFFASFWEALFADNMGPLPAWALLPVALTGWALGYFYTRLRGTGA